MGLELALYVDAPLSADAVEAPLACDPAVRAGESGGWYAHGLQAVAVEDLRQRAPDRTGRFGFVPTVEVWAQLRREIEPEPDGDLPGMNTFLALVGRMLAAVPGDAAVVQNYESVFLYRRGGAVTLLGGWLTDVNRSRLAVPHRERDFTPFGGPEALAVVDAP